MSTTESERLYGASYPPTLWTHEPVAPAVEGSGAGDSGASPAPDPAVTPADDPAAFTIVDIQAWVGDDAALAADVAVAERARGDAARSTLLAWLDNVAAPEPAA